MAFDINDRLANFSNIGPCTDLGGPGVNITAGWNTSPSATATISGTSMSAPHVAGVALLYLAANPGKTVPQVNAAIINGATNGVISGVGGGAFPGNSPNKNLNMEFISGGGNIPPVANWTYSCTPARLCTFTDTSTDPDGTIVAWSWQSPNGAHTPSTAASWSHTFNQPRNFSLRLTVTDNGGATSNIVLPVSVP
jgi:serine protease